jgi:hypothetical protein
MTDTERITHNVYDRYRAHGMGVDWAEVCEHERDDPEPYTHADTLREGPNTSTLPASALYGALMALLIEACVVFLGLSLWSLWVRIQEWLAVRP